MDRRRKQKWPINLWAFFLCPHEKSQDKLSYNFSRMPDLDSRWEDAVSLCFFGGTTLLWAHKPTRRTEGRSLHPDELKESSWVVLLNPPVHLTSFIEVIILHSNFTVSFLVCRLRTNILQCSYCYRTHEEVHWEGLWLKNKWNRMFDKSR